MPLYDYRDKTTGEIKEYFVKISEREQFLIDNPNLESVVSAPAVGNRFVTLSSNAMKPPQDYTNLLKGMKKFYKGSNINVR